MRACNLLLLIALAAPHFVASAKKPDCSKHANGVFIPDQKSCSRYYICINGRALRRQCAKGFYFDGQSLLCNLAPFVDCRIGRDLPTILDDTTTCAPPATTPCPPPATPPCPPPETTPCPPPPETTPCPTPVTTPCSTKTTTTKTTTTKTTTTKTTTTKTTTSKAPTTPKTTTTTCSPASPTPPCSPASPTPPCPPASPTPPCPPASPTPPCSQDATNPPPVSPNTPPQSCECTPTPQPCTCPSTPTTPCPTTPPCTATTPNPSEDAAFYRSSSDCASLKDGTFLLNRKHCRRYYVCYQGKAKPTKCSKGEWFDKQTKTCRISSLVTNCLPNKS